MKSNATASSAPRIDCSTSEWEARVDLACAYRVFAHFGWHQLVYNHITMRVPGEEGHFLINPFGLLYHEVTASNILKVDINGNKLTESPWEVLKTGFVVHSAVHRARRDVACVMHTHTVAGVAVSCQAEGLLPLNLSAMLFTDAIGYHEVEGITLDLSERDRIAQSLGSKNVLILRNHGLLTCGQSVGDAFHAMYQLNCSCEIQLAAQASGARLTYPSDAIARHVRMQSDQNFTPKVGPNQLQWAAMRRWMESLDPTFMD